MSVVVFLSIVPIAIGRTIFGVIQLPPWLVHDPICFIIGILGLLPITSFISNIRFGILYGIKMITLDVYASGYHIYTLYN